MQKHEIKKEVRQGYAKIAKNNRSCCGTPDINENSCCSPNNVATDISKKIGYSEEELKSVPDSSNLGLGCGNPVALASLIEGETVMDLGSGAGFDCFLAANKVGQDGRVIGIDMTPEMIDKARNNAIKGDYHNVEFRLGEIEHLPAKDNLADIIISNCVINLSPDKRKVFKEAFRVLKPGGRLMISDIVLLRELPDFVKRSIDAYIGCVSGAELKETYLKLMAEVGFQEINIVEENSFPVTSFINDPTAQKIIKDHHVPSEKINEIARSIVSVRVFAVKPSAIK